MCILRVTGTLTNNSTATGVFVIVSSDYEVIYHKATRKDSDKIIETVISGLAGGEYSVSVLLWRTIDCLLEELPHYHNL